MYRREAEYVDFDGNKRKETFYFNLTEAEILKMEWNTSGGLAYKLMRIINKKDGVEIMKVFDEIIDASYGVKSPDGRTFMKTPEALAEFKATTAYNDLYKEICTDSDKAIEFINQIIPVPADPEEVKRMTDNVMDLLPNGIANVIN